MAVRSVDQNVATKELKLKKERTKKQERRRRKEAESESDLRFCFEFSGHRFPTELTERGLSVGNALSDFPSSCFLARNSSVPALDDDDGEVTERDTRKEATVNSLSQTALDPNATRPQRGWRPVKSPAVSTPSLSASATSSPATLPNSTLPLKSRPTG